LGYIYNSFVRRKPVNLRIPGPTPCPENVLKAMSKQMINHRGPEFKRIIESETAMLKEIYQTKSNVFMLTCSGTGSMEAAIVNFLSPGEKVLALSIGAFGDRFATIAEIYGADVTRLSFEWGQAVDPEAVKKALDADPKIKTVLVTHNETSTAVTNDLATIGKLVKEYDKLLLVDAISSLGCIDLQTDAWGCDVVVSGSQKGWMVPPGLAFISVSDRAWKAHAESKMPRFYFDVSRARDLLEKGQTPWTPAVSIFFALEVALKTMMDEGIANVFARHSRMGRKTREGVKSLGLKLFANESAASNTITAIVSPDGLDANEIRKVMLEKYNVVLAGGQAKLAGKIFRIGHLGYVTDSDLDDVLAKLPQALSKLGYKLPA
jgi:aspartate aminotransferase-like enzyme